MLETVNKKKLKSPSFNDLQNSDVPKPKYKDSVHKNKLVSTC